MVHSLRYTIATAVLLTAWPLRADPAPPTASAERTGAEARADEVERTKVARRRALDHRTEGIVFLAIGAASLVGAGILAGLEANERDSAIVNTTTLNTYYYTKMGLFGIGGMLTVAGLPMFVSSFFASH